MSVGPEDMCGLPGPGHFLGLESKTPVRIFSRGLEFRVCHCGKWHCALAQSTRTALEGTKLLASSPSGRARSLMVARGQRERPLNLCRTSIMSVPISVKSRVDTR